jgi:hypothetical protein
MNITLEKYTKRTLGRKFFKEMVPQSIDDLLFVGDFSSGKRKSIEPSNPPWGTLIGNSRDAINEYTKQNFLIQICKSP